jgi:hypothetical protein
LGGLQEVEIVGIGEYVFEDDVEVSYREACEFLVDVCACDDLVAEDREG